MIKQLESIAQTMAEVNKAINPESQDSLIELPNDTGEKGRYDLPDDSGERKKVALPDDSGDGLGMVRSLEQSVEVLDEGQPLEKPAWLEAGDRPTPRESELKAQEIYGGIEQRSFLNGQEVPYGTPGSTRPDLTRVLEDGSLEAIEVKNYDLREPGRLQQMVNELKRQITDRAEHMPENTKQRVFLDLRGQNLSDQSVSETVDKIKEACKSVCPNLAVDVLR